MRIAYSIASLGNSGGMERVLSTKVNYFAEVQNYEVHVVVGGKRTNGLFYHFSDKVKLHFLDVNFTKRKPWHYIWSSDSDKEYRLKLSRVLKDIHADITISFFGRDAAFLYKLDDGSKKILEFHFTKNYLKHLGDSLQNDRFRLLRKYWLSFLLYREKQLSEKYDHIVLLTEKDKQLWGGGSKFEVIPNPLSFISEKSALLENKRIISMGRLVFPKGFQYLIRAFSLLVKEYPDWQIVIFGEGQDKKKLQELINELSLQDQVFLKEPVQNVEEEMLQSSIFVLSSLYDGFGLVLTEAMTCGVPCIAFDCECGPSEIIRNGKDGYLVELGNTEELATKMNLLMDNQDLRQSMGKASKQNVMKFEPEKIMNCWIRVFNKIISEK